MSDEVEEVLGRAKAKSQSRKIRVRIILRNVVGTLDKLHAKHVLPGFSDRSAEEREIERQTSDITRVRRTAQPYPHKC